MMLVVLRMMIDDDANFGPGDSEVNSGDYLSGGDGGDGNSNNKTNADYDGEVDSNIDDNAIFGERKSKVGYN